MKFQKLPRNVKFQERGQRRQVEERRNRKSAGVGDGCESGSESGWESASESGTILV